MTDDLIPTDTRDVDEHDPQRALHLLREAWLDEAARSPRTRVAYEKDFDRWIGFLERYSVAPLAAAPQHVTRYRRELEDTDPTPSPPTVARRISTVSSFYNYCEGAGLIVRNPAAKVSRPKVDDYSPTVGMTRDEAQRLVRTANQRVTDATTETMRRVARRDAAIIALMVCTGGRVTEVCSARVEDLGYDGGRRVLAVTRKGAKRQSLPLGAAAAVVDRYVVEVAVTTGLIFTTRTGRAVDRAHIFRVIRRVALAAHIPAGSKLSPHSLRHTFATLALDSGASLYDVQQYMGHADPRTTERYDRARGRLDRAPVYKVAEMILGGGGE